MVMDSKILDQVVEVDGIIPQLIQVLEEVMVDQVLLSLDIK